MLKQTMLKNKVILRFLFCNLLILLILSMIMLPYLSYLYKESKKQAYAHQEKLLTDCTTAIIKELETFQNFSNISRCNPYISQLTKSNNIESQTHFTLLKAQSYLYSTFLKNIYIKEFYFAFRNNDIYLSPNYCIVSPKLFYGTLYGFPTMDYATLRKTLLSKNKPFFLPKQEVILYNKASSFQAIPFIIPVCNPYISYPLIYDTYLICYLDIAKISKLITSMDTELVYYYLTYNDQTLFLSGDQNHPKNTSSEIISADNDFHLRLHAMVKPAVLTNDIKKASLMFQTCILIATAFGIVFSILTALYNGIPVIKLRQKIASLDSTMTDSKRELLQYKNNEIHFYFSCLIDNSYQNYSSSKLAELFPFLCIPYRMILCTLTYTTDHPLKSKKDLLSAYRIAFPDTVYSELTPSGNFLFILNETQIDVSYHFIDSFEKFLHNNIATELYWTCVISEPGTQISDFYSLYAKIERILRIRFEPDKDILLSADLFKSDEKLPISVKTLQTLYQQLLEAHSQESISLIEGLYHTIHTGPVLSEKYLRSAYFSIHNVLAFVISDLRLPILIPVYQPTDTLCKSFTGLIHVAKEICFYTKKEKTEKVNNTIDNFYDFLKENFKDPDLSPVMIAQHLGFSEKYLFNYIKTNTGRTISSHILEIRMLYAANALLSQDKKVQEIAEESGFYTINSFYKNFKKCFGDSPAIWRKNNIGKAPITKLTFLP